MAVKRKMSGTGLSLPAGIGIGVLTSAAVSVTGALLMAYLIMSETVSIDSIGFGASCTLAMAAAVGCWMASWITKRQKLLVTGVTALAFFLVLLSVTAVFFDGVFSGVGLTALMILLGAGGSLLTGLRKKTAKSRIKIPVYR